MERRVRWHYGAAMGTILASLGPRIFAMWIFIVGLILGTFLGAVMQILGYFVSQKTQFERNKIKFLPSKTLEMKLVSIKDELGTLLFQGRLRCRFVIAFYRYCFTNFKLSMHLSTHLFILDS
jgi:hypothetical protein